MKILNTAAALTLLTAPAFADDVTVGDLTISQTVARPTAATAMAGAGYLQIVNNGDAADRLIAVEADFPRVMLHETVMDGDVAKMEHLMGVSIAAGETVTFEPGGKHVMFMGLNGDPFELDERIPATLVFENAGRIALDFVVTDIEATGGDHD